MPTAAIAGLALILVILAAGAVAGAAPTLVVASGAALLVGVRAGARDHGRGPWTSGP